MSVSPAGVFLTPIRSMAFVAIYLQRKDFLMRVLIIAGVLAAGLAGCQTVEQSAAEADTVCLDAGHRPGTRAFERCRSDVFQSFRRSNAQASNAVAAGVVAGAVGGAVIAASSRRHYGYYGCGYYGCW